MNIAIGDEAPRVARLYRTEPERRVSRLRRQYVRDVGALNVLVMQGRGVKYGILARLVRSIDVHRQPRAISHGNTDVPLLDHRSVSAHSAAFTADIPQQRARCRLIAVPAVRLDYIPLYFTIVKYNLGDPGCKIS